MIYPKSVATLIEQFQKFPSVGPKSAQRMAFHLLKMPGEEVRRFSEVLVSAKEKIFYESIDPETKKLMEENQIIKEENNDIIHSLDNLQDLKKEYDNLMKINLRLKNEIKNLASFQDFL